MACQACHVDLNQSFREGRIALEVALLARLPNQAATCRVPHFKSRRSPNYFDEDAERVLRNRLRNRIRRARRESADDGGSQCRLDLRRTSEAAFDKSKNEERDERGDG